jgi:hypothetical protein
MSNAASTDKKYVAAKTNEIGKGKCRSMWK